MWVPWRGGNPGQQGRGTGGQVSHARAVQQARSGHRREALSLLRAKKITRSEYDRRIAEIERKFK